MRRRTRSVAARERGNRRQQLKDPPPPARALQRRRSARLSGEHQQKVDGTPSSSGDAIANDQDGPSNNNKGGRPPKSVASNKGEASFAKDRRKNSIAAAAATSLASAAAAAATSHGNQNEAASDKERKTKKSTSFSRSDVDAQESKPKAQAKKRAPSRGRSAQPRPAAAAAARKPDPSSFADQLNDGRSLKRQRSVQQYEIVEDAGFPPKKKADRRRSGYQRRPSSRLKELEAERANSNKYFDFVKEASHTLRQQEPFDPSKFQRSVSPFDTQSVGRVLMSPAYATDIFQRLFQAEVRCHVCVSQS